MNRKLIGAGLAAAALTAATALTALNATAAQTAASCSWQLMAPPEQALGTPVASGLLDVVAKNDVMLPTIYVGSAVLQPDMLRWNGRAYAEGSPLPLPYSEDYQPHAMAMDGASDGWLLGYDMNETLPTTSLLPTGHVEQLRGGNWRTVPLAASPDPANYLLLPLAITAVAPGDAWLAGSRELSNGKSAGSLIEHWDGRSWSVVADPAAGRPHTTLNAIKAFSPTDIWAAGDQVAPDGTLVPLVERYDGTRWSDVTVAPGNGQTYLDGIGGTGGHDVWLVGSDAIAGSSTGPFAEHWDGTSWQVSPGLPQTAGASLTGVYSGAAGDVWATVRTVDRGDSGVLLHFDGSSWTTTHMPGPQAWGSAYWTLGIDGTGPGDVWAYGGTTNASGTGTTLIVHYTRH